MLNQCSFTRKPVEVNGITLCTIWNVEGDAQYDISAQKSKRDAMLFCPRSGKGSIVLRTLAGHGRIYLAKQGVFEATGNTLLLFNFDQLERYHASAGFWRFWWFEFIATLPLHLPRCQLLHVATCAEDKQEFVEVCHRLRRETLEQKCLAAAGFLKMLYRWQANSAKGARRSAHQRAGPQIIDRMYDKLGDSWAVSEMAASVHMSVSGFRKAFHEVTGKAPKVFYDQVRLAMAEELLRQNQLSVSEVAARLGYCNPYHFSKIFRRQTGVPPSAVQTG
jgi:AraC-like DNA-binding protein